LIEKINSYPEAVIYNYGSYEVKAINELANLLYNEKYQGLFMNLVLPHISFYLELCKPVDFKINHC
jgi:hypothetical protein